jgi:hypothetical protein
MVFSSYKFLVKQLILKAKGEYAKKIPEGSFLRKVSQL